MSLPTSQPLPEDLSTDGDEILRLPPARRRRGRRLIMPKNADQRAAFLTDLAHRATPSFDFLIFSLLSGVMFGAALLWNSPALFLLAALVAPFMGPVIGLALATIVGSGRFFLLSLGGSLIGAVLVFLGSLLAGFAARIWPDLVFEQALLSARFAWPTLLMLSLGIVVTIISMIRSDQKPSVPSVALAYALYLPVAAAGFGISSGTEQLFPGGLIVFLVFLSWSTFLGTLTLAIQGFRPLNMFGYTLGTAIALTSLAVLIGLSGLGTLLFGSGISSAQQPSPSPTLTAAAFTQTQATPLPAAAEVTSTPSPEAAPPTLTREPTHTLVPTRTPTITITAAATPVWALIAARNSDGAIIRELPDPSSTVITSILNGSLVEVLPGVERGDGAIWVQVRTNDGKEGWILQTLLQTATPSADW